MGFAPILPGIVVILASINLWSRTAVTGPPYEAVPDEGTDMTIWRLLGSVLMVTKADGRDNNEI